jgi:hypothetical protein
MLQQKVIVPLGTYKEGGHFNLIPFKDKVLVEPCFQLRSLDGQYTVEIMWEEMLNFPVLVETLGKLRMEAFKPVAEALGVMYANRHIYEALIE